MKNLLEHIRGLVRAVLDAVLPPRPRKARTENLTPEDIPLKPTTHDLLGVHIMTLLDYENPIIADLVQSLKYDGSGRAAHLLASVLADYLRDEIASHKLYSNRRILLVPVPLHPARKRERGFNQIEVVLKALPQEFRDGTLSRLAPEILERIRATKPQTRLHRHERLSNVAGAFGITDELVRHAQIYLIDDVTTTGATLANAATPLRRAGAEVTLLALARA
jgi:ComF family protein